MLMSVAEITSQQGVYPELAGARVLITGLGPTCGVDIARAFAEHGCRLVLQIPEPCPETDALLQVLSEYALDLRVHHDAIEQSTDATRFAQTAAKTFGGLEAVVNLIRISRYDLNAAETLEDVETMFSTRMLAAAQATRVAANRMGLTWSNGSILNVLRLPPPTTGAEAAITGIARTALAAMTRSEAANWADNGIRVNAVAPQVIMDKRGPASSDCMRSEPDIAAVALYLASEHGARDYGPDSRCRQHCRSYLKQVGISLDSRPSSFRNSD